MKTQNSTFYIGKEQSSNQTHLGERHRPKRENINGSEFRSKFDPIAAKREEAKKKAMKVVGDVFANDLKIDDDLNLRKDKIRDLLNKRSEAVKEINEIEKGREALREECGVDKDSQEEKDLKLLEKEIDSRLPGKDVSLTEEEKKRVLEIRKSGLSEYQKRSLEMKDWEVSYEKEAYEATQEIKLQNQVINQTEIERLKSHAMVDAKSVAEEILNEANSEIVNMLVDEAKEHVDEKTEEEKKAAKEKAKEKEELESKIEKAKERRKEKERFTEDILEGEAKLEASTKDMEAAKQEVRDMMSKMNLIEDDIKGAAVDKSL